MKVINTLFCFLSFFSFCSVHSQTVYSSTLKVGGFDNQAPYVFTDGNNKPLGFAVDLLDAALLKMDRSYELTLYDAESYTTHSLLKECDILLLHSYDPQLALTYLYSNPYDEIGYDVLTRRNELYTTPRQLIGKVLILLREGLSEHKVELFGLENVKDIIYVENLSDGLNILSSGVGDYIICATHLSNSMATQKELLGINTYDSGFSKTRICYMFTNVELGMKLNKAIELLVKDGTYKRLYNKWLGSPKPLLSRQEIAVLILLFTVILLLLSVVIWALRGRVRGNLIDLKEKNLYISNLINSIHWLNKLGDVTILMFDVTNRKLSVLQRSDFIPVNISLAKLEGRVHPNDKEAYLIEMSKLLSGIKEELSLEFRLYNTLQGRYNDYSCIMNPVRLDDKGGVLRYILSLRNETDQKNLIREREEALKSLSMALGVAKIIRWKYNWEEQTFSIFDKELHETILTRSQVLQLIRKEDVDKLNLVPRLATTTANEYNVTMWHKLPNSELYKPYEVYVSAIRDKEGHLLSIHGISYDISEVYDYQQQLNGKIELLETIEENMPVGMFVYDKNGYLQSTNKALVALLGLDRQKLIDARFNLFHDRNLSEEIITHIKSGMTVGVELTYQQIYNDFAPYIDQAVSHASYFNVKCTPVKSALGELKGYVSIYIDTTQLYEDKQEIKLLKDRMILALHAGELTVLRYKPKQQTIHVMNGDSSLEGKVLTLDEVKQLSHKDDWDCLINSLDAVTRQSLNKATFDMRIKLAAQAHFYRWYRLSFTAELINDEISSLIGTVKDVTKEVEAKILLQKAKEKAEMSERLKMAFLANMSHEIRTPLNAIVGFSELLQYAETEEDREEYIKIISKNNELLLRLIGDILDLSKIESGSMKIKRTTFDIVKKFNEIYHTTATQMIDSDILFSAYSSLESHNVVLDEERVAQVMNNFLSNAIKYTTRGEIVMGLTSENNGIKFSVSDTGDGIDEANHPYVFQRFQKFNSFVQGTGLGLAICKAISDLLRGDIGFTSIKGVGSTFWVWFPSEFNENE